MNRMDYCPQRCTAVTQRKVRCKKDATHILNGKSLCQMHFHAAAKLKEKKK